ncbi:hypothetical protein KPL71_023827 [Citrus sinensis]|uniref:Uncharacterized protein n=1 Tax=Citrus sinensis TaxID=2711 RepID=A0ACB8INS0_CITSI|nr:hypothetical protein KPL71_023827 [Citrus sinensis]
MVKIFSPILHHALIYIDDILLFSHNHQTHQQLLSDFLEIVQTHGIMLSEKKSNIGKESIDFLGMVLKDGHYHPGSHITVELLKFPDIDLTKKQIQQFLGIVNYVRDFIPKVAVHTSQLSCMLKKHTPPWGPAQTDAVKQLKKMAQSPPPFRIPTTGQRILQTDASDDFWSAILLEKIGIGLDEDSFSIWLSVFLWNGDEKDQRSGHGGELDSEHWHFGWVKVDLTLDHPVVRKDRADTEQLEKSGQVLNSDRIVHSWIISASLVVWAVGSVVGRLGSSRDMLKLGRAIRAVTGKPFLPCKVRISDFRRRENFSFMAFTLSSPPSNPITLSSTLSLPKSCTFHTTNKIENLVEYSYIPESAQISESSYPLISPYQLYKRLSSFTRSIRTLISTRRPHPKEYIQSSRLDQCSLQATSAEQYVTLEIPSELISNWKRDSYTHLHLGGIRLILTLHGRKGLLVTARIAMLDARFKHSITIQLQSRHLKLLRQLRKICLLQGLIPKATLFIRPNKMDISSRMSPAPIETKVDSITAQMQQIHQNLQSRIGQLDSELRAMLTQRYNGPEFDQKEKEIRRLKAELDQIDSEKQRPTLFTTSPLIPSIGPTYHPFASMFSPIRQYDPSKLFGMTHTLSRDNPLPPPPTPKPKSKPQPRPVPINQSSISIPGHQSSGYKPASPPVPPPPTISQPPAQSKDKEPMHQFTAHTVAHSFTIYDQTSDSNLAVSDSHTETDTESSASTSDSEKSYADITKILMAQPDQPTQGQTSHTEPYVDIPSEVDKEMPESSATNQPPPAQAQPQPNPPSQKSSNGPWFTFDDLLSHKWRDRLNEMSAWIDLQMLRPGATTESVLREYATRFTVFEAARRDYLNMKCCSLNAKDLDFHYKRMPLLFYKLNGFNEDINPTKATHPGMSPSDLLIAQKECLQLLAQGLIELTSSQWACQAFYVEKHFEIVRGKKRLVIDYQPLNMFLQDDKFPLPRRQSMFTFLKNAQIFFKFDLKSGFWQLGVEPSERYKTAFCIPNAHFQWTVLPFGLKTAPSIFQKSMVKIFQPILHHALIYIDDILLFSGSHDEHRQLLTQFYDIVQSHGIMLSAKKSTIATDNIEFLGMLIKDGHYQPGKHIAQELLHFPDQHLSKKQVQQFLGIINYIRDFIPHVDHYTHHLSALLKKKPLEWNADHTIAVTTLKQIAQNPPPLKLITDGKRILQTYASDESWGAILLEELKGKENVIAYASGQFSDTQKHYHSVFKEILAIKNGIKKFEYHLIGHHFLIRMDNSAFPNILNFKGKTVPEKMLLRLKDWFSKYDFSVKHIKGSQNLIPDMLSRLSKPENPLTLFSTTYHFPIISMATSLPPAALTKKTFPFNKNFSSVFAIQEFARKAVFRFFMKAYLITNSFPFSTFHPENLFLTGLTLDPSRDITEDELWYIWCLTILYATKLILPIAPTLETLLDPDKATQMPSPMSQPSSSKPEYRRDCPYPPCRGPHCKHPKLSKTVFPKSPVTPTQMKLKAHPKTTT